MKRWHLKTSQWLPILFIVFCIGFSNADYIICGVFGTQYMSELESAKRIFGLSNTREDIKLVFGVNDDPDCYPGKHESCFNEEEMYRSTTDCLNLNTEENEVIALIGMHYSNNTQLAEQLIKYRYNESIGIEIDCVTPNVLGLCCKEGRYKHIITYRATDTSIYDNCLVWTAMLNEDLQVRVIIETMQYFGWHNSIVLTDIDDYSIGLAYAFSNHSVQQDLVDVHIFFKNTIDDQEDLMTRVRATGIKIITVFTPAEEDIHLREFMEELNKDGPEYTFILPETLAKFYHTQCIVNGEDCAFLQGHLVIKPGDVEGGEGDSIYEMNIEDVVQAALQLADNPDSAISCLNSFIESHPRVSFDIGFYDASAVIIGFGKWMNDSIEFYREVEVIWPGNLTKIPNDGSAVHLTWSDTVPIFAVVILSFILIILLITIGLVVKNSQKSAMKHSSPAFLILILVGLCIFNVSMVTWIGNPTTVTCSLKLWLGFIGFGITSISLIAKTWRIRKIFNRKQKFNVVVLTNFDLIKFEAALLLPYIITLIVWQIMDPPTGHLLIPNSCTHKHTVFSVITLGYSFMLIIVMMVLSIQTRNVPALYRETFWINLVSYSLMLNGAIAVILAFMIDVNVYLVVLLCSVVAIISTWGFLYIPKLYVVYVKPSSSQETSVKSLDMKHTVSSQ